MDLEKDFRELFTTLMLFSRYYGLNDLNAYSEKLAVDALKYCAYGDNAVIEDNECGIDNEIMEHIKSLVDNFVSKLQKNG